MWKGRFRMRGHTVLCGTDGAVVALQNAFYVVRQVLRPVAETRQSYGDGADDTQPGDTQHTPDALMATYYGQRATAGLIITEGTSPSPNGLGYPRIPGLYDAAQVDAWKATTAAVHAQGGKIFVQLMHCGRVAHVANLPTGAEVLGPGTAVCPGEMFTDTLGLRPYSPPRAMTEVDIAHAVEEHVAAAKLALDAGFDGIELHGANGYLIEQFLNPLVNVLCVGCQGLHRLSRAGGLSGRLDMEALFHLGPSGQSLEDRTKT